MTDLRQVPDRWRRRVPDWWRRRVPDRWRRLDVVVRDLPLALGLAGAAFLPVLRDYGTQLGELPARPSDGWAVLVVALLCLPLAVRRRWPAVCIALVSLGFAVGQLQAYQSFAGNALGIALVSTGLHLDRRRRAVAVGLTVAYVALALALDRLGSTEGPDGFVTFYLALVLAWGIGAWLRAGRAAEAEQRRLVAQETRTAERTRIARELHDVVTHHVTAMVVQTEAAKYLTAAPDRLGRTLDAVTDTGRRAIADLRRLLDLLDPGHDGAARTPSAGGLGGGELGESEGGLGESEGELHESGGGPHESDGGLRELVERTRQAGQPVELTEDGTAPAPASSAELVAYRVVQEALTNALKHAYGSRTVVRVRRTERETIVEVSTTGAEAADASVAKANAAGTGTAAPAPAVTGAARTDAARTGADDPTPRSAAPGGSGRGLAGLRQRVDALGGEFTADRRDDGGFVVRARIPQVPALPAGRP